MNLEHLKLWTRPECYMGAVWPDYYVFLGQHRDSDCLTRSNFTVGLKNLGGESETVIVVRENHWAVGWIEWIAIHQDDEKALAIADRILADIDNYPVLDECHFSELEMQEANEIWRNCYNARERVEYIRKNRNQFDFAGLDDARACIRGDYFIGYASELIN
jgi:hypothetical protein